jgi:general secretion pathway protein A
LKRVFPIAGAVILAIFAGELLYFQTVLTSPAPEGKAEAVEVLYKFLIQKYGENKRVLLIIDEAQALPDESMDELRMLSNLQSDEQLLLQIMLVGQPELREKLKKPLLSPFAQRVAGTYHLSPLSEEETRAYIGHRLEKAGGKADVFEPETLAFIYQASHGFPRSINLLCDAALVYGFGYELKTIGVPVIEKVIEDKGGLGLDMMTEVADRPLPASMPEGAATQDLLRRLETLEQTVRGLKAEMAWRSEEMDRRVEKGENRLVIHLKGQLDAERAKRERLLMKYSMLVERYKSIKGNRLEPERMKKDFDIEPVTSISENAHHPKRGLFSWLKGNRTEEGA